MSSADRELVATRLLNAPRALVWTVWTDPHHVARWWGPDGFTTTIHTMDVRPGGVWDFIMHGPDGVDYPNTIVFREIDPPARLVYDHGPVPLFHVTVTFDDLGNGTTNLTMRARFDTAEELRRTIEEHGAAEGMQQHLGRLEAYVEEQQAG